MQKIAAFISVGNSLNYILHHTTAPWLYLTVAIYGKNVMNINSWFYDLPDFLKIFSTCCDTTLHVSELSCDLQFCVHAGMTLWTKSVSKSVCATQSAMYYKVE